MQLNFVLISLKRASLGASGGPVVKNPLSKAECVDWIPGWETEIPHALGSWACATAREKCNTPQWRPCVPQLRPDTAQNGEIHFFKVYKLALTSRLPYLQVLFPAGGKKKKKILLLYLLLLTHQERAFGTSPRVNMYDPVLECLSVTQ